MKSMLLALAFISTLTLAYAEPIFVNAKEMTCTEFQSILQREGAVQIMDFFGNLETHFHDIPNCPFGQVRRFTFTRTLNVKFCQAGYVCEPDFSGGAH